MREIKTIEIKDSDVLREIANQKRQPMEVEVYRFFEEQGLNVLPYHFVQSKDEIEDIVTSLETGKYVCKVMSPKILHKSDFHAVRLNVDKEGLAKAFDELQEQFSTLDFQGVLIVPMVDSGVELLVGSSTDPTFGVITVFGLGGTLVEIIKDVTFAKSPISINEAKQMIGRIRTQDIFDGPRGMPKTDKDELAKIIRKISEISQDFKMIIKEIDLNPVRVTSKGIFPLDARLIVHPDLW